MIIPRIPSIILLLLTIGTARSMMVPELLSGEPGIVVPAVVCCIGCGLLGHYMAARECEHSLKEKLNNLKGRSKPEMAYISPGDSPIAPLIKEEEQRLKQLEQVKKRK